MYIYTRISPATIKRTGTSLLSFVLYLFSACSPIFRSAGKPRMPALPCRAVDYRGYSAVASFPSMPLYQGRPAASPCPEGTILLS